MHQLYGSPLAVCLLELDQSAGFFITVDLDALTLSGFSVCKQKVEQLKSTWA